MRVRGEEGEAALGHEAGEVRSAVSSSVLFSGPKHIPIRAQVTGAASATSSASSSADEEFDTQPSLRSKVTRLDKPKKTWLVGIVYHSDFRPNMGSSCGGFIRGSHSTAADSNRSFTWNTPRIRSFFFFFFNF